MFWGTRNVLHHDCRGDSSTVTVYICQNSLNYTLKIGETYMHCISTKF